MRSSQPPNEMDAQIAKESLDDMTAKLLKNIRKEIYFENLPQANKQIVLFDIFNDNDSNDEVYRLREMILNYVKWFD